jgi:hypothetical protein
MNAPEAARSAFSASRVRRRDALSNSAPSTTPRTDRPGRQFHHLAIGPGDRRKGHADDGQDDVRYEKDGAERLHHHDGPEYPGSFQHGREPVGGGKVRSVVIIVIVPRIAAVVSPVVSAIITVVVVPIVVVVVIIIVVVIVVPVAGGLAALPGGFALTGSTDARLPPPPAV